MFLITLVNILERENSRHLQNKYVHVELYGLTLAVKKPISGFYIKYVFFRS